VIVDSSAIVAIVQREPGWEALLTKLLAAPVRAVGAPTLAETGLVLVARLGPRARPALLRLLQEADLAVVPFGEEHWRVAVEAYASFGKGRHAAGLNFGDCLAYATARLAGQPLLATGADFPRTDLSLA
jgi:ribonuclease VapC